jgi:ubiquitin-conjugating enzyme E2 J1
MWQPAWGVRTGERALKAPIDRRTECSSVAQAILGLQGFFPLKGQAAVGVGSIEYPASERKRLATL